MNTLAICLTGGVLLAGVGSTDPTPGNSTHNSIATTYRERANRIIEATLADNDAYKKLEELCDDVGNRLSGSENLNNAIRWAVETFKRDGQENVHTESVMVPRWVRGRESLELILPRRESVPMLGLGGSVGTPAEGITADVIAVYDEKELDQVGEKARGKIVLFNFPMDGHGYGTTVRFRTNGARLASEYGAVAALVRSVTTRSLQSPHTGAMRYGDAKVKIPTAAVSVEYARKMARLLKRGKTVRVTLNMQAKTLDDAPSANVVAELRGSERPDEVVVISGHLDSWDVGQGAHDDGAGVVTAMETINILRKLDLRPRRTIRAVLWTNEENGLAGGKAYAKRHESELSNYVAAIEMDSGGFAPTGYGVSLSDEAAQNVAVEQLADVLSLLESIGATNASAGGGGADIGPMKPAGVPMLGHRVDGEHYFDYHHTHADTLDKVDPDDMSKNAAAMAVVAYILADMPGRLGAPSGG